MEFGHSPFQQRVVDVVESQPQHVLERSRLTQAQFDDRLDVDEAARVRQRHQSEVPAGLGRAPLAGGAVRQRVHLAGQLRADDAELARTLESERRHLRVRVVAEQLVRLVDLRTVTRTFLNELRTLRTQDTSDPSSRLATTDMVQMQVG